MNTLIQSGHSLDHLQKSGTVLLLQIESSHIQVVRQGGLIELNTAALVKLVRENIVELALEDLSARPCIPYVLTYISRLARYCADKQRSLVIKLPLLSLSSVRAVTANVRSEMLADTDESHNGVSEAEFHRMRPLDHLQLDRKFETLANVSATTLGI